MSLGARLSKPHILAVLGLAALTAISGCKSDPTAVTVKPAVYVDHGFKPNQPDYMHNTVFERTDVSNADPYLISGYSIVVNLQNTGDNTQLPRTVREAMIKRLALEGFGSKHDPRYANFQPEDVLKDKRVAVVQVKGYLPVGARKGQLFDLVVQAMPRSATSSLAHGHLFSTELRDRGIEQPSGGGTILAYADADDVFVNPEYALTTNATSTQVKASLRTAVVMGAGRVTENRPIYLQLRVPQASIAREIEGRVINRFQANADIPAAAAQDEGIVSLYLPVSFMGDWQHFMGIVNHLYLNDSPDFNAQKARMLVAAIRKPGANLTDISFCLEGLGPNVLPIYQSLINDPDPNIAFYAARAAVFCDDPGAQEALTVMATTPNHPFQLAAVHTLGQLRVSPAVDKQLEPLLASNQALVRIEAYKILAAHGDRLIMSHGIPTDDANRHFTMDVIECGGPPLIYATRSGEKRLAIFGQTPAIAPPIMYSAMDNRLTISSDDFIDQLTLFYRDPVRGDPINIKSGASLQDIAASLGGRQRRPGDPVMNFIYGDVVAIIQSLADSHRVAAMDDSGTLAAASFVLEQPAELTNALNDVAAPDIRPQGDPMAPPGRRSPTDMPGTDHVPDFGAPRSNGAPPAPPSANSVNPPASGTNSVPAF